jgi:hypothetical protein
MKYIISGLSPGEGGVPKLLEYLEENSSKNFKIVTPPKWKLKNQYLNYYYQLIILKIFRFRLLFIRRKDVVLIHFQSIGLDTTKFLIKNNNSYLYLIDNTFFCLKSYNNRNSKECLDCLYDSSKSIINNCKSLNYNYDNNQYIDFYDFLRENYNKIKFLTLSDTQSKLLKKFISDNIHVKSLYFLTNDLDHNNKSISNVSNISNFDFVFHGSDHPAKGSDYILKIAEFIPQYTFLFPFKNEDKLLRYNIPENVTFKVMSWETGLKESVQNARLVFTPSTWSNTPEASTLKSILENGNVAMIETEYGFVNELKNHVLCLTGNVSADIEIIIKYLQEKSNVFNSKNFIYDYKLKAQSFKEFFEI